MSRVLVSLGAETMAETLISNALSLVLVQPKSPCTLLSLDSPLQHQTRYCSLDPLAPQHCHSIIAADHLISLQLEPITATSIYCQVPLHLGIIIPLWQHQLRHRNANPTVAYQNNRP